MKRLTEPKGFVNGIACQERGVELYWRLKRYEDIGLEPEEIIDLLEHLEIEVGELRQELADERYHHDRLQDFEVAEAKELRKLKEKIRWIPVTERLPELIPCASGSAYSEAVIVWTTGRKAMVAIWDGIDFLCAADYWDTWGEDITNWMPLPEPPKECDTEI